MFFVTATGTSTFLQAAAYYTHVYFVSTCVRTLAYSFTVGVNFMALSNGTDTCGEVIRG